MGHLVLPGIAGNFASALDIAAYDLNDTFFLATYAALDNWASGEQSLVGQFTAGGNQRSYKQLMNATGRIGLRGSDDGAANEVEVSDNATGYGNGTGHWTGCNFNGGVIQLFEGGTNLASPAWVQNGGNRTLATVVSCHNSTGVLEIGSQNGGTALLATGGFYRTIVYSDLARSTRVFDADFTDLTQAEVDAGSFIEDSPNAAVVTLNGTDWSYVFDRRVLRSPRYGITRMARR